MKMEAISHQGKRADQTLGQLVPKSKRSSQIIGDEAGESYKQVQRYIRLTELLPELLSLVDDNTLKFGIGVELSYLTKDEQQTLLDIMKQESVKPSLIQAKDLHRMSKDGECTEAAMFKLLTVVAEGVENARQWNFLIDHGCDLLQGYFAAEPLSEAEFFDFYNRIEVE